MLGVGVNLQQPFNLFVPGRLCLFGEHSDWAGGYRRTHPHIEKGYTLICGTNQGMYAQVTPHPHALELTITTTRNEQKHTTLPLQTDRLYEIAQQGGFWSYIAGTTYQILRRYSIGGLTLNNYKTDLPMQKGLSSSAAICVLIARAFNRLYDLGLTVQDEMELAYLGEITTPSQCGRMDQGCAFGNQPILMTFDGDEMNVTPLSITHPFYLVMVDLGGSKDTVEILADLNACYPVANTPMAQGVQQLFGALNKQIVQDAIAVLEVGDALRLGQLMTTAQAYFDQYAMPASPRQLTAPLLHSVLTYPSIQPYIYGGKGVGSQGDGTCQLLAKDATAQQTIMDMIHHDLNMHCLPLQIGQGL